MGRMFQHIGKELRIDVIPESFDSNSRSHPCAIVLAFDANLIKPEALSVVRIRANDRARFFNRLEAKMEEMEARDVV
jgi:hypothetical protein